MTEHEQLTPAEAQAVMDLWHLREQHRYEEGGFIRVSELAEVLQCAPVEVRKMAEQVRSLRPAQLTASPDRLSSAEAETVVSLHAQLHSRLVEPISLEEVARQLQADESQVSQVLEISRERHREFQEAARSGATPRSMIDDFGIAVGENPRSWAIMWAVLGFITVALLIGLLIGQVP